MFESRSTSDPTLVYPINGWELKLGDKCEKGSQLRPNIVWFGEMVPMMEVAAEIAGDADIFIVAGTSMVVYPAAGLVDYVRPEVPKFVVDPNKPQLTYAKNVQYFTEKASTGMMKVRDILMKDA